MVIRTLVIFIFGVVILCGLQPSAHAEKAAIYTGLFSNDAVQGYDVVAYFTQSRPVKGSDAFTTDYKGALWKFSSQDNLEAFLKNPEKYEPQYGGYCAYAVAIGATAKGDARYWNLIDGKLYLNLNKKINAKWLASKENYIADADENWPAVLQ